MGLIIFLLAALGVPAITGWLEARACSRKAEIRRLVKESRENRLERERQAVRRRMRYATAGITPGRYAGRGAANS